MYDVVVWCTQVDSTFEWQPALLVHQRAYSQTGNTLTVYQLNQLHSTSYPITYIYFYPPSIPIPPPPPSIVHVCYSLPILHAIMSLPPSSSSNPTEAPAASGYPAPSATALARSTTIKPDPSNTIPFSWSCKCNNVQVNGRIRKELEEFIQRPKEREQSTGAPLTSVWVDPRGEQCVSYYT